MRAEDRMEHEVFSVFGGVQMGGVQMESQIGELHGLLN